MRRAARVAAYAIALAGLSLCIATPPSARADDDDGSARVADRGRECSASTDGSGPGSEPSCSSLSAADLEAIDHALTASAAVECDEPRDRLRSLRDAYARHEATIVRNAISARLPMALDALRFCIETAGSARAVADRIAAARQALEAVRDRPECSIPTAGLEQLISAWEAETSPVVRSALESRLDMLAQTTRFCLETVGADRDVVAAPPEPGAPALPGGRALGSPFQPPPSIH